MREKKWVKEEREESNRRYEGSEVQERGVVTYLY